MNEGQIQIVPQSALTTVLQEGPGKNFLQVPDASVERRPIFQEEDVIETKRIMNRPTDDRELKVKGYAAKSLFQKAKNRLQGQSNTAVLKAEIRDRLSKRMFVQKSNVHKSCMQLTSYGKGPPKPESQSILPLRPVDTQAEVYQLTTYADAKESVMSPYIGSLIDEVNEDEEAKE